jgi:hypothetical protein
MKAGALALTLLTARDIIAWELREQDFESSPLGHDYTPDEVARCLRALVEHIEDEAEPTYVECDATLNSWDYFNPRAVDKYDMRCDLTIPHEEHENNHTGAKWRDPKSPHVQSGGENRG